jgi:hypothetical protein
MKKARIVNATNLTTVSAAFLISGAKEVVRVNDLLPAGLTEPILTSISANHLNADLLQNGRSRGNP